MHTAKFFLPGSFLFVEGPDMKRERGNERERATLNFPSCGSNVGGATSTLLSYNLASFLLDHSEVATSVQECVGVEAQFWVISDGWWRGATIPPPVHHGVKL